MTSRNIMCDLYFPSPSNLAYWFYVLSAPGPNIWCSCTAFRWPGILESFWAFHSSYAVCWANLLQSCPTLCYSMDYSPPGSSFHGILQVRILEWVAMPSSRGSSQPKAWTHVSCLLYWQAGSLPLMPPGKPILHSRNFQLIDHNPNLICLHCSPGYFFFFLSQQLKLRKFHITYWILNIIWQHWIWTSAW